MRKAVFALQLGDIVLSGPNVGIVFGIRAYGAEKVIRVETLETDNSDLSVHQTRIRTYDANAYVVVQGPQIDANFNQTDNTVKWGDTVLSGPN